MSRDGIRIRTQYPAINFTVYPDGALWLNGEPVGKLFPDEYQLIAVAVSEDTERKAA